MGEAKRRGLILPHGMKPLVAEIRRVMVGMPAGDMMHTSTSWHYSGMLSTLERAGYSVGQGPAIGSDAAVGQNFLIDAAFKQNVDALLLVDSDMIFPPDAGLRLIKRNLPIVGAYYRARVAPHAIVSKKLGGAEFTPEDSGVQEADYVPAGMLFIRTYVLRSMRYPWFYIDYGDAIGAHKTGDVSFCRSARAAGHKVWADCDLSKQVGHLATVPVGLLPNG